MNFSICIIAKNESKTLPRCLESLKTFMNAGGNVVVLDTGSIDGTPDIARNLGCIVQEVGEKFITTIDLNTSLKINQKFIVSGEKNIVEVGSRLFDFAAARNHCASLAPTNHVIAVDADEYFTTLDFERINKFIEDGIEMFETRFIFAHDEYGKPVIEFLQNRFYNKKKMEYVGIVHEIPMGHVTKIMELPKDIYMLEHKQELGKDHRPNYIVGLALDCYQHQEKDRQSHYFARELMYAGRFKSAIKEFLRHITIGGWPLETAQSMIFIGDCYGQLNIPKEQVEWYHKSFYFNSERRESLIKLAQFYKHNNNPKAAAVYATAALQLPLVEYYGNDMNHYTQTPHELLYWALGWMGDIKGAQNHLLKAKEYQPANPIYSRDSQYYFEYPDNYIPGWMTYRELLWLYETSKKFERIGEIGSWMGRSTHALLSGCKNGQVFSVDHFMGSADPIETGHQDVYGEFLKHVGHFKNLEIIKESSIDASKRFDTGYLEMVFIDGGHQYHEVIQDINTWLPKCSMILCGHDYEDWGDVKKAVDDVFGKPDEVIGNIWVVYLDKRTLIQEFIRKIKFNENFSFVKKGDGELHCMNGDRGFNNDNIEYEPILGDKLQTAFNYLDSKDNIYIPKFNNQRYYNCLLHRIDINLKEVSQFYKSIINSRRKKIYIAPRKLREVAQMLGALHYMIPDTIHISQYVDIINDIKGYIEKDCIIMFSCGLFAKPFIYECILKNSEITCLDLGSAFDPFIGATRTHQVSKEKMFYLYKEYIQEDLPMVSIIIPTLGRPEGLKKCLESIKNLNYPKEKLETIVIEDIPRLGVPLRIQEGYEKSIGEYICYAANDMEFTPDSLRLAINDSIQYNKRLVAFDTGVLEDDGYICEHFIIKRSLVEELGEIFDIRFKHASCDIRLWERAAKLNEAMVSNGYVIHKHYSRIGSGIQFDEINQLVMENVKDDRALLKELQDHDRGNVKFDETRVIQRLALPITRWCNRRCPECTAVERKGFPADPISIEELQEVGQLIGKIKKIEVTGGEPTGHPQFKWISENLHSIFDCNDIMLLTNGWGFRDDGNLSLLLNYDRIYITHYNDRFAALYKERQNTDLVNKLKDFMKDYPDIQFWVQEMDSHVPNKLPVPWVNACLFDYDKGDMVSYHKGKLYGCCTSWQLNDQGAGITLTENWRQNLKNIELPCSKCFLGIFRGSFLKKELEKWNK